MSQYGHYTITFGRYIKRRNMSGKCLFLPLKGSNFHLKYDFLTLGSPLFLPTKYRNFAQSTFKGTPFCCHYTNIRQNPLAATIYILGRKRMEGYSKLVKREAAQKESFQYFNFTNMLSIDYWSTAWHTIIWFSVKFYFSEIFEAGQCSSFSYPFFIFFLKLLVKSNQLNFMYL